MTNIIHNGFNCPNCRAKMAEEPSDEETEDDNSRPWSGTDDMSFFEDEDREIYEDDMLRGFRMFNNRINGEEHEYEDIGDEYVYQNYVLNEVTRNAGINEVTTNEVVVNAINEVVVNLEDEVVINEVINAVEDDVDEDDEINTGVNLQLSEEEIERLYERNGEDYYNRINSRNDGYVFYGGGGFHRSEYLDECSDSDYNDDDYNDDYNDEYNNDIYNEIYNEIFIRTGVASGATSDAASDAVSGATITTNGTQSLSAVLNVADDEEVRNYFREAHIITN
jgi:hypothetical protein